MLSRDLSAELAGGEALTAVAGDTLSVAVWTALSRATGLARVGTIAAVLGPTYLGNLFQATNLLPNITYELLTGSLLASLLVPAIVRHHDADDDESVARIAGGFLTLSAGVLLAVTLLVIAGGPLLVRLLTAGVHSPVARAAELRVPASQRVRSPLEMRAKAGAMLCSTLNPRALV